jgi:hypothetical protein
MINQWKDYPGTICKLEELLSFDYYGYDDLITVRVDVGLMISFSLQLVMLRTVREHRV